MNCQPPLRELKSMSFSRGKMTLISFATNSQVPAGHNFCGFNVNCWSLFELRRNRSSLSSVESNDNRIRDLRFGN